MRKITGGVVRINIRKYKTDPWPQILGTYTFLMLSLVDFICSQLEMKWNF